MMNGRTVIVIGGPTASGKTDIAIALAKKLGTEIISADSRQVYRELKIGVARPNAAQLAEVEHYFIADKSIHAPFNAGMFAEEAEMVLQQLLNKHRVAIVCGGTGLYIKALLHGLDALPETPELVRSQVSALHETEGLTGIQRKLLALFPEAGSFLELKNPARVMRALELCLSGGKSPAELWLRNARENDYGVLGYYLDMPREILYQRIEQRSRNMFAEGLVEEAAGLTAHRQLKALNTVGYAEVYDYLDGKCDLDSCIQKVQQHTRNYAKRQITWFKNSTSFTPVHPDVAVNRIFEAFNKHGFSIHQ